MSLRFLQAPLSAVVSLLVISLLIGCSRVSAERAVDGAFVDSVSGLAGPTISLEVCADNESRARGLMFRKSLEDNQGMIFVFPNEAEHFFWMKNTYIPLDMVFLSKELRIIGILENTTPLTEDRRSVGKPSTYVVELAGGAAKRFHLKEGDSLRLHGALPAAL